MAEDTATAAKTEYRVLRKVKLSEIDRPLIAGDDGEIELYVLEPNTYTGNVKRAVYDDLGEGEYVKVAARSFDQFVARKKEVVTFQ